MERNELTAETVYEICLKMDRIEENNLFCIDYLIAALGYEEFYVIMTEFAVF